MDEEDDDFEDCDSDEDEEDCDMDEYFGDKEE